MFGKGNGSNLGGHNSADEKFNIVQFLFFKKYKTPNRFFVQIIISPSLQVSETSVPAAQEQQSFPSSSRHIAIDRGCGHQMSKRQNNKISKLPRSALK